MLRAVQNKSWKQHPTKQQLYGNLPPITKTIQVSRTKHAGHSWRSKDELISDILLWTPSHGWAKEGRPARIYIYQLCADTGYSQEDLLGAMDDRDRWRERDRKTRAGSARWWWWLMLNWIVWNRTVYFNKMNLALNHLQRLIWHKTQTNKVLIKVMPSPH